MAGTVSESTARKEIDKIEISEWKGYQGDLPITCDGATNRGAFEGIISTFSSREKGGFQIHPIAAKKSADGNYKPRMQINNLKIEGWTGSGAFGTVWKAVLNGEQDVAVKQFNVRKCNLETIWIERDALIYLKSVGNRRVVNLVGAFFDVDAFLVMELCVSSLSEAIGHISDKDKARFMVQLLQGLSFIHSRSIWHCDIRPANLLITTSNNLVLADFGKSIYAPGLDKINCKTNLGISYYSDYEANCESKFSSKTDVWAAGCSIYEFSTGKCLMRYGKRTDVSKFEYGQVARFGKRNSYSQSSNLREPKRYPLEAKYNAKPFARILRLMLTPTWNTRLEAEAIINGGVLSGLCRTLEIDLNQIENDTADIIAKEPIKRAPPPTFKIVSAVDPVGALAVNLCGIYYDELEKMNPQENAFTLYRPLASLCGADFLQCLQAQGVFEDFIKRVSDNDPISFALCTSVVEKSLGMKRKVSAPSPDASSTDAANFETPTTQLIVGGRKVMGLNANIRSKTETEEQSQPSMSNEELKNAGISPIANIPNKPFDDKHAHVKAIREPNSAFPHITAADRLLSLNIFGTTVSLDQHAANVLDVTRIQGKHTEAPENIFARPKPPSFSSAKPSLSKVGSSTYPSVGLASDNKMLLNTPDNSLNKDTIQNYRSETSEDDIRQQSDGQNKSQEDEVKKRPTKRSLSPGRSVPTSAAAVIPTSKPAMLFTQPQTHAREIERGSRIGRSTYRGRSSLCGLSFPRGGSVARGGTMSRCRSSANGMSLTRVGSLSDADNIDHCGAKNQQIDLHVQFTDLNEVMQPNTSSGESRRKDNIDPEKTQSTAAPSYNKLKTADPKTGIDFKISLLMTKKRPLIGALEEENYAIRKQQKKEKNAEMEADNAKTIGINSTHRQPKYKCINYEKGCNFRGEKDIVSTHMKKCDLNSSDDSENDSSASSSAD